MHVVLPNVSSNDLNIIGVANLAQKLSDPLLNPIYKHAIPILGNPDEVNLQIISGMTCLSVIPHKQPNYRFYLSIIGCFTQKHQTKVLG